MKRQTRTALLQVWLVGMLIAGCSRDAPAVKIPTDSTAPAAGAVAVPPATPLGAGQPITLTLPTRAVATTPTSMPATRGLIKGTISDAAGAPVSDAAVVIVEGTSPWPEMATYSSAAGAYQWLVEAGTYTLEASRDGYAAGRGETTVAAGQEAMLDIALSPP